MLAKSQTKLAVENQSSPLAVSFPPELSREKWKAEIKPMWMVEHGS